MAGRQTADIVFCMDASGSMRSAFDGVRDHVKSMLESIRSDAQSKWDVRFDFLAYSNTDDEMRLRTVSREGKGVLDALYRGGKGWFGQGGGAELFTSDLDVFRRRLDEVQCEADEATLFALDLAADFPFRDSAACHRAVVLLTDEPVKAGTNVDETASRVEELARKYQDRKIALFMVTPPCPVFDSLSQADKCEWTVDESAGLRGIDFAKLMGTIGKSVSVSQTSQGGSAAKPLFGEDSWRGGMLGVGDWVSTTSASRGLLQ